MKFFCGFVAGLTYSGDSRMTVTMHMVLDIAESEEVFLEAEQLRFMAESPEDDHFKIIRQAIEITESDMVGALKKMGWKVIRSKEKAE